MPTLLQFNAALNKGSTGRIVEQIAALARENGWVTYTVHGARYQSPSQMYSIQSVSLLQENLHALRSFLFDAHGLGSRFSTEKVISKIDKIRPDLVHLHNIHGYYLNYEVLFDYLRNAGIPIVWTLHDCWAMTGHCVHFDAIQCNKWKIGCDICPARSGYPKSLLLDNSKRNYILKKKYFTSIPKMVIVPVSHWLEHIVKQSFLKDYPVNVIYNGVDVDIFKPTNNELRKKLGLIDKFVLLGVATAWHKNKGLYDYIELSRKLPMNYKIVLIGVDRELKKKLPNTILGIERTNDQKELAEYYSMADVVLNLSYEESFGLTTVEGFACGTPSIVYNRTASPELITFDTGCIVEAGNIDEIVASIKDIKQKGKLSYKDACRQRAMKYFNKDDKFKEYLELYNSMINT